MALKFHPLTADRWNDLEALFGPRGACGGCWCMTWRLRKPDFENGKKGMNKQRLRKLAASERPPGILAYDGDTAVGWCSVGPRTDFPALERSRILAPIDDKPVWSITCFFVAKGARGMGVSGKLVAAACAFAKKRGAKMIEGYPNSPGETRMVDLFAWTGLEAAFLENGFAEAARRSKSRPVFRKSLP